MPHVSGHTNWWEQPSQPPWQQRAGGALDLPPLFDIPEWWRTTGAPWMQRAGQFFAPMAGGPSPFRPAPQQFRTTTRPTSPWQQQQFRGTAQTYLDLGLDPSQTQFGREQAQARMSLLNLVQTRAAKLFYDEQYVMQMSAWSFDDLRGEYLRQGEQFGISPAEQQRGQLASRIPTLEESRAGEARTLREFAGYPAWQTEAETRRFARQQFGYKEIQEMGETIPELKDILERLNREWIETGGPEAEHAGITGAVSGERAGQMTVATQAQRASGFAGLKRKYQEEMHVEFPQIFPAYLDYQEAMFAGRAVTPPWTFNEWMANTPSVQAFLRLKEKEEEEQKGRETRAAELRHRTGRTAPIAQR